MVKEKDIETGSGHAGEGGLIIIRHPRMKIRQYKCNDGKCRCHDGIREDHPEYFHSEQKG